MPEKPALIHINVIIADRPYPLKIKPEEEEVVRKAARVINDKIKEFQRQYAAKDKQDYLAMCALMYVVDALKKSDKVIITDPAFLDDLNKLENMVESFFRDNPT